MDVEVISISKFKATCLSLLTRVKQTGKSILVTRRGEPIALVQPPPSPRRPESWIGAFRSEGEIVGDVISPAVDEDQWEILAK